MASINASTSGAGGVITTADATGTLQLQSGGTTIATISSTGLALNTGNITLPSGAAPTFSAYLSAAQTLSNASFTKIACNTETWDTANAYDNATNYRFTPQVAGYYLLNCYTSVNAGTTISRIITSFYKNGGTIGRQNDVLPSGTVTFWYLNGSAYVYLNGTTDYVELYMFVQGTGTLTVGANDANTCYFQASFVRAA